MIPKETLDALDTPLRRLQIVVLTLAAGSLLFAAVAFVLRQSRGDALGGSSEVLAWAAGGWAALSIVLAVAVERLVIGSGLRRIASGRYDEGRSSGATGFGTLIERLGDPGRLFALFQTGRILRAALLEGPALLAGVVYLLGGGPLLLGLAVALGVGLALVVPTRNRLAAWLEDAERQLDALRAGGATP